MMATHDFRLDCNPDDIDLPVDPPSLPSPPPPDSILRKVAEHLKSVVGCPIHVSGDDSALLAEWSEEHLREMLAVIRGEGPWRFTGKGIHTYPHGGRNERSKYVACCELERRGLARRHHEDDVSVCFVPAEADTVTPAAR